MLKRRIRSLTSVCIVMLLSFWSEGSLFGQHRFERQRGDHRAGFVMAAGSQSLLDVRYKYLTTTLAGEYQYILLKKGHLGVHGLAQPHIVFTRFNVNDNDPVDQRGFEFGLNMGLVIERHVEGRRGAFYAGVSSGPHFLLKETHRQTSGPIFSSALFVGYAFQLTRHLVIDIRPGYRHISNAGIYIPNGGINNSTLSAGLFYHF